MGPFGFEEPSISCLVTCLVCEWESAKPEQKCAQPLERRPSRPHREWPSPYPSTHDPRALASPYHVLCNVSFTYVSPPVVLSLSHHSAHPVCQDPGVCWMSRAMGKFRRGYQAGPQALKSRAWPPKTSFRTKIVSGWGFGGCRITPNSTLGPTSFPHTVEVLAARA